MKFEFIKSSEQELKKFYVDYIKINLQEYEKILNKAKIINVDSIKNIDVKKIEDIIGFVGTFEKLDNEIIIDYNLCLPKIIDIQTLLINIHELAHTLITISNIGTKYQDNLYSECIPIAMERLYILNFQKNLLLEFNKYQLSILKEKSKNGIDIKYLLAFYYQFELCELYKFTPNLIFNHRFDKVLDDEDKILKKVLEILS